MWRFTLYRTFFFFFCKMCYSVCWAPTAILVNLVRTGILVYCPWSKVCGRPLKRLMNQKVFCLSAHTVNVTQLYFPLKFHHKTSVICYDHKSKFSLQYWHCQFSLWAFLLVIHFQVIFFLLSHSRSMMDRFIRPSSTRSSHHGNNQSGTSFFILSGAFKTFLSWFSFFCIDANTVVTSSAKRLLAVSTAVTDGHWEKGGRKSEMHFLSQQRCGTSPATQEQPGCDRLEFAQSYRPQAGIKTIKTRHYERRSGLTCESFVPAIQRL